MTTRLTSIVIGLLTCLALTASPVAGAGTPPLPPHWAPQKSPTTMDLTDVSCPSSSECVAVGANATIVKTVNGGKTWTVVHSAYGTTHPTTPFASVRCPVSRVCSVIAGQNVVLRTTNGGQSWQAHTISLPVTLSGLGRIACPIRNACLATASPSGPTNTWFTHSAAIFKTSDGNKTWHRLSIPSSVTCPGDCGGAHPVVGFDLQWISCQNAQSCYAGGDTFIGSHEGYASAVLRTKNGGTSWTLVHHSFDPNIGTCPTTTICTGVFYQPRTPNTGPYLERSTNGGKTWTPLPQKAFSPLLTSIACTGTSFCALVGPHGKVATTSGMTILKEASPTTRKLAAVACPKVSMCYAVCARGTIVVRKNR